MAITTDLKTKKKGPLKDLKAGLTTAGRKAHKEREGANLKPGVKGPRGAVSPR